MVTEAFPGGSADEYPQLPGTVTIQRLNFDLAAARTGTTQRLSNGSVREISCNHVLQYLTGEERIQAWNEWYRILLPGGRVQVVVPHYSHARAFAHPLTKWPPMSDLSFMFLDKAWREKSSATKVPTLECDFEIEAIFQQMDNDERHGYAVKNQKWQDDAAKWFWNVMAELTVWLVKR